MARVVYRELTCRDLGQRRSSTIGQEYERDAGAQIVWTPLYFSLFWGVGTEQ